MSDFCFNLISHPNTNNLQTGNKSGLFLLLHRILWASPKSLLWWLWVWNGERMWTCMLLLFRSLQKNLLRLFFSAVLENSFHRCRSNGAPPFYVAVFSLMLCDIAWASLLQKWVWSRRTAEKCLGSLSPTDMRTGICEVLFTRSAIPCYTTMWSYFFIIKGLPDLTLSQDRHVWMSTALMLYIRTSTEKQTCK